MKQGKKQPPDGAAGVEPGQIPSPADEGPTQPYLQPPTFEAATDGEGTAALPEAVVTWDGPTRPGEPGELPEGAIPPPEIEVEMAGEVVVGADGDAPAAAEGDDAAAEGEVALAEGDLVPAEGEDDGAEAAGVEPARLESILESLLFASDRPLAVSELKRLVGERDTKKVTAALESLRERREEAGIQLASIAGGWQLRTNPGNAAWVTKLVAAKPQRLSRALLETLAIVAYRQPITRPEIDDIRGVDCGPVLKTLLDRGLVRMIGKKEDVGRPILYGTTPEFLRTFSLKDLAELPTLREFHELSAAQMAEVDAKAEPKTEEAPDGARAMGATPAPADLPPPDPEEEERLLRELDDAAGAASRAAGPLETKPEEPAPEAPAPEPPPAPDGADAS